MIATKLPAAPPPTVRNAFWMTAEEVAIALDCSDRSVWKWEGEGVIPAAVRRGKKWTRWRRAEVEAYRDGTWTPAQAKEVAHA